MVSSFKKVPKSQSLFFQNASEPDSCDILIDRGILTLKTVCERASSIRFQSLNLLTELLIARGIPTLNSDSYRY